MYLKPAPCRALESALIGRNLRGAERLPMREFKGMSGAPKSLCYVWQGRTWDRLTGASHVPYGDTGLVVVGAPRAPLLYPPRSGQGREEMSLDLMADPVPKG